MRRTGPEATGHLKGWKEYAGVHWAWPAIVLLAWCMRRYQGGNVFVEAAIMFASAGVIIFGWKQVARDSYWQAKWAIFLGFAAFFAAVVLSPILIAVLPLALLWLMVDLFFIAPRRH